MEMAEQQPELLKSLVQMVSSKAAFPREIHSCGEGAKRWDCSMQVYRKCPRNLLQQRTVRRQRESILSADAVLSEGS